MPPVLVGIMAALAATAMVNGGSFLQSLDARHVGEAHALRFSLLRRLVGRPRWLLGLVLGYLAFPVQLVALLRAPMTLVQPVHAVGLLILLAIGAFALREPVRRRDVVGVVLMLGGLSLLGWGTPTSAPGHAGTWALAETVGVLTALAVVPFAMRSRIRGAAVLMACSGFGFAGAALAGKGISDAISSGDVAGGLGWLAVAAVGGIAATLTQMTAFQREHAMRVVPVTFALPTFVTAMAAPLLTPVHWGHAALGGAVFAIGLAGLAFGILTLARASAVSVALAASRR